MGSAAYLLIPDLAAIALCAVAAAIDLRHHRIPNWLTFSGAAGGLLANAVVFAIALGPAAAVSEGLLPALAGGGIALAVFFVLGAIGAVGMGDVKLIAAAGAFVRWPLALTLLVAAILAGGVLALAYALARARLGAVLKNVWGMARRPRDDRKLHRIPYGAAILAGCAAAVLSRHTGMGPPF